MQVLVEGLLYSNFSLKSWFAHMQDSYIVVILDLGSLGLEAIRTTNWQLFQFSGNGNYDHEADT